MSAEGEKAGLRKSFRALKTSFPLDHFALWNKGLALRLPSALAEYNNDYIAIYQPRAREASVEPLFALLNKFCFPKVLDKNGLMEFRWVQDACSLENFEKGHFGILEPGEKCPVVSRDDIRACFVPLVAFDLRGGRLGNGKGYYDRYLEGYMGKKIGVAFEWQKSELIPMAANDVRLDCVVTESSYYTF